MEHNRAARKRGKPTHDRGSRRYARAVHARRRLNAPQAATRTKVDRRGPNPRYAYLTQMHD